MLEHSEVRIRLWQLGCEVWVLHEIKEIWDRDLVLFEPFLYYSAELQICVVFGLDPARCLGFLWLLHVFYQFCESDLFPEEVWYDLVNSLAKLSIIVSLYVLAQLINYQFDDCVLLLLVYLTEESSDSITGEGHVRVKCYLLVIIFNSHKNLLV